MWNDKVVPLLKADRSGELEAKTVLEELRKDAPEAFDRSLTRTLQRRMRDWRALQGPNKEVFFPQVHVPGREAAVDFTHGTELGVTIRGVLLVHQQHEERAKRAEEKLARMSPVEEPSCSDSSIPPPSSSDSSIPPSSSDSSIPPPSCSDSSNPPLSAFPVSPEAHAEISKCSMLTSEPCPSSQRCSALKGVTVCEPAGSGGLGGSCTVHADCQRGLVCVPISGVGCLRVCDPTVTDSCGAGIQCLTIPGATDVGVCLG